MCPYFHRACVADLLIDAVDDTIASELDANVFSVIALYCDLGAFERHVRRGELDRRAADFEREDRRLRETVVQPIENG